jgi:hypothetical protein
MRFIMFLALILQCFLTGFSIAALNGVLGPQSQVSTLLYYIAILMNIVFGGINVLNLLKD